MSDIFDDEELGRNVIRYGQLKELRERLKLSRNTFAEMLYVDIATYRRWELRPDMRLTKRTKASVGRFYRAVSTQLETLTQQGIDITGLQPLHYASVHLAVPQEVLMERYRNGELKAVDLGVLGLWVRTN